MGVFKYECPYCLKTTFFNNSQANKECGCPGCLNDIVPMRTVKDAKPLNQEASLRSDREWGFKYRCLHCSNVAFFSDSQANKRCGCPICFYDIVPTRPGPVVISEIFYVPRKRLTYILLGIFFGWGSHNIYAGFVAKGVIQGLCAVVISVMFEYGATIKALIGLLALYIWVLCDIIGQKNDANKVPMS